jgi:glycosyltransferase involved in cell wall biosynthesis
MQLSVLIPTFNRPGKLAACVSALSQQTLTDGYEVLVGIDGSDSESEPAARRAWNVAKDWLKIFPLAKQGQASIRNQLLKHARGRTLVFLNDDMIPDRRFLETHLRHQLEQEEKGRAALIVGDSPWRFADHDSLFHRLIRETSMVFFYNVMKAGPDKDWGFRHAWLLNLSAPAALVREVGGFTVFPSTYGYEDDELAFRLAQRFGTRVLYREDAIAVHDHLLTPAAYLKREYQLGFSAWGFANTTPDCARAMFHRDITAEDELSYCRAVLDREAGTAQRLEKSFANLATLPAETIKGESSPVLLNLLYEHHLPLKRYHWRRGLIAAASQSQK